jgi:hypothetical protein
MRTAEVRACDYDTVRGQKPDETLSAYFLTSSCTVRSRALPNRSGTCDRRCSIPTLPCFSRRASMSTAGLAARLTSHSSTLWTLQNHNLRLAQLGGRRYFLGSLIPGSWRETLVMEKDHDNFTRCCRPSHRFLAAALTGAGSKKPSSLVQGWGAVH